MGVGQFHQARLTRLRPRWDIDWDYWEAQTEGFGGETVKSGRDGSNAMNGEGRVIEMAGVLQEAQADAAKHDRGNAAAGRRVRKALQTVKVLAQECRKQIQADKASR